MVVERVQRINAAAERGTWQAAAWMLERRHPEEFSTHGRELAALRKKVPPEEESPKKMDRGAGRRPSRKFVPIARPKKLGKGAAGIFDDVPEEATVEQNDDINNIRALRNGKTIVYYNS